MRSLSIVLLLTASVLAQNGYTPYPMDAFDDIYNRDLKLHPDSTFSFNFEQTRLNQPSQIEMREETVGKYFNRKPQTTTPVSIFSMNADREPQHVYPQMVPVNNYQHQGRWNNQNTQQVSAVPPPPKFAFSRSHNNNQPELRANSAPMWNSPTVQHSSQPRNSFINNQPYMPLAQPAQPVPQWTAPPKISTTSSPYYAQNQVQSGQGIRFSPSASYVSDSISNNRYQVPQQATASRGHHKFSWDDIKPEERPIMPQQQTSPQVTSTPQGIHKKPPPPVPTLTPWYDNFGK